MVIYSSVACRWRDAFAFVRLYCTVHTEHNFMAWATYVRMREFKHEGAFNCELHCITLAV